MSALEKTREWQETQRRAMREKAALQKEAVALNDKIQGLERQFTSIKAARAASETIIKSIQDRISTLSKKLTPIPFSAPGISPETQNHIYRLEEQARRIRARLPDLQDKEGDLERRLDAARFRREQVLEKLFGYGHPRLAEPQEAPFTVRFG